MIGSPATFARRLLRWYDRARRDLPWRVPPGESGHPDPYRVLVSEAMLQQTQVAAVVPYFHRFLERFPTLASLAAADEQDVLRLWQGLGYYSRARNLRAAARAVVQTLEGQLPCDVEALLKLPGVGRYTAGAIASIAFGTRAPILDGNVVRVLCRLDRIEADPRSRDTQQLLWRRAEEVLPKLRVGDFNSALMELGATVCIPRSPQCLVCPVREHCAAHAAGVQDRIPPPKQAKPTPLFHRYIFCIRRADRWLIEQRPPKGRWAGMWQFVTTEPAGPDALALPVPVSRPAQVGELAHGLTHRRYHFVVFACEAIGDDVAKDDGTSRKWVTMAELAAFPLPRPHVRVVEMIEAMA